LNSDFKNITRFGEELGNVNAIGMIIGISSTFCFYFISEEKRFKLIPILLVDFIVILLTGSRKSLILLVLSFIIIIILQNKSGFKGNFKILTGSIAIALLCIYLINEVPIFYEIIGQRINHLMSFITFKGTGEGSINERASFIEYGYYWFVKRPLLGYGIDNYRFLLENKIGLNTYSHNNFIELLVGTGIFGTLIYYYSILIIFVALIKSTNKISHPFIAIIAAYIIISVGLVYYDNKHFLIVLTVGNIVNKLENKNNKQNLSQLNQSDTFQHSDTDS
jgi:Lipid A core - O-antigen ligase and related enzymes